MSSPLRIFHLDSDVCFSDPSRDVNSYDEGSRLGRPWSNPDLFLFLQQALCSSLCFTRPGYDLQKVMLNPADWLKRRGKEQRRTCSRRRWAQTQRPPYKINKKQTTQNKPNASAYLSRFAAENGSGYLHVHHLSCLWTITETERVCYLIWPYSWLTLRLHINGQEKKKYILIYHFNVKTFSFLFQYGALCSLDLLITSCTPTNLKRSIHAI